MQAAARRPRRIAALAAVAGVAAAATIVITIAFDSAVSRGAPPSPELVSVASTGTGPQQVGAAGEPSVSADGKLVVYTVAPLDGISPSLAYLRDRSKPAAPPVQVPLPTDVTTVEHPVISGNGCVVAFWGLKAAPAPATAALYTWSRCPAVEARSEVVEPSTTLALTSAAALARPALSTDGASVAYAAAPAATGWWHVGLVARAPATEQVIALPPAAPPILSLTTVDVSGDGTTVVFDAGTVAGSPPTAVYSWKSTGAKPVVPTLVSVTQGGAPASGINAMPSVSKDAATIAFVSNSADFGVTAPTLQLYVGPAAGPFRLVTGSSSNTPQSGNVVQPDLTPDGTQVAYTLGPGAVAAGTDVPVGQPSSVLVARLAGTSATTVDQISAVAGVPVAGTSSAPAISETGRFTVYESDAGTSLSGNPQFGASVQIWSTERRLSVASTTDLGTVDVGTPTAPVAIAVTNPLTGPVSIGQIAQPGSGFVIGPDTCSNTTIAGGATCVVTVVFTAFAAGAATATLTIAAGDQTATSGLKAAGRRRLLTADSPRASFPPTAVGALSDALSATFRNAGEVPVAIAATKLQDGDAEQFVVVSTTCGGALAVNASCSVAVVAQPSSTGSKHASLVVSGGNGESASVTLSVDASLPTTTTTARPTPTTARPTPPPTRPAPTTTVRPGQLSASPTSLAFPTTAVDVTSDPLSVTVANAGGSAVAIDEVSISGGDGQFSVADDSCRSTKLGVGQACTVSVVVRPAAGGEAVASLTVRGSRGESTSVNLLVESSYAPTITIAPGVVRRGNLITVVGTAFPTDRAVVLQLATAVGTAPALPLGVATTDAAGAFVTRVVIPQHGIAAGGWQVIVVDQPDFTGVRVPVLVDQDSPSPGEATGASGVGGIPRPGPALP